MSSLKKSKIVIGIAVIGIVTAIFVYQYAMRPPAQIEDKAVDFTGTSTELLAKVQENAEAWQDKVVVISGEVTDTSDGGFVLSSSIFCQLKSTDKVVGIASGNTITLKGRVIGYDDLLEELKLDQCIIQQEN